MLEEKGLIPNYGSHETIFENKSMMLLEYCDNGDLFDLTSKSQGISDLRLLKSLFKQVLGAVSTLHNHLGMGHFDIKLENVLIANSF